MSDSHCTVAVDVGNSAAKVGLRCHSDAILQSAFPILQSDWIAQVIAWVNSKRPDHNARTLQWRIASVKRSASQQLVQRLSETSVSNSRNESVCVIRHADIPIKSAVERREQVGIDRLIAAFAAENRYGRPVIIVDAGSAVTVDLVDEKSIYRGGAIMPGIRLQLQSLARDTDALPEVDLDYPEQESSEKRHLTDHVVSPATNTHDAIRLGVVTGIASAIDRLAAGYMGRFPVSANDGRGESAEKSQESPNTSESSVVLTGGDAVTVARFLTCPHQLQQDLVCRGILDLPLV